MLPLFLLVFSFEPEFEGFVGSSAKGSGIIRDQ